MSVGFPTSRWFSRARRRHIKSQRCAPSRFRDLRSNCRRWRACRSAHMSKSSKPMAASPSPASGIICRRSMWLHWILTNRISSLSLNASSARRICGAAGQASALTARGWCRPRSPPPALPRRATATCRKALWEQHCRPHSGTISNAASLIFWKGHVAIVRDGSTIVHANALHMATAIEPTQAAIARIKAAGSDVTSIKRLS